MSAEITKMQIILHALYCSMAAVLFLATAPSLAASDPVCSASPQYLSDLKSAFINPDQDFSCMTDLVSLGSRLTNYQIIDIRAGRQLSPIKDAWLIPVSELKNKLFLIKRPLLLVGDGFSRAASAHDCAKLKKAGFTSLKILVGGDNTWAFAHGQRDASTGSINARQFLYEYFNGNLIVLAASPKVAAGLSELGLVKVFTLADSRDQRISDMVLTKSSNGYDPVVVIGDDGYRLPQGLMEKLPNLYFMPGGIAALKEEIKQNLWSKYNRENLDAGSFCAAK